MRRLALLAICVACKTASSASSQASAKVEQQTDAQGKVTTTETVRTGPEDETRYKFALPSNGNADPSNRNPHLLAPGTGLEPATPVLPSGVAAVSSGRRSTHLSYPVTEDDLRSLGPLVEIDFIHRSPAVAETRTQATAAVETRTETKTEATAQTQHSNAPAGLLGGLVALWPLALLGGLAVAGWIGWRVLRSRVP